ncbi:Splicing factor 3B subunit 5/RDS3 complex subunit 10 - like 1 [Theobroma cacao]|nr:Splicing factor 3B subunit 5/RDS3 complex subunit 10 - like 1 [Theobroma cacao]
MPSFQSSFSVSLNGVVFVYRYLRLKTTPFSEWAVNIQRDSYASYIGHCPILAYFAVAENESIGRERYNFMQVQCKTTIEESKEWSRGLGQFPRGSGQPKLVETCGSAESIRKTKPFWGYSDCTGVNNKWIYWIIWLALYQNQTLANPSNQLLNTVVEVSTFRMIKK